MTNTIIRWAKDRGVKKLCVLSAGDTFMRGDDLYLLIPRVVTYDGPYNAVCLATGTMVHFGPSDCVEPVNVTIEIRHFVAGSE